MSNPVNEGQISRIFQSLKGKKIIVTGASRGLGYVCSKALAECGASLALISRSADKLEELNKILEDSQKHRIIPADLMDKDQISKAVEQSKSFLGDVDVVLHVMGGGLGMHNALLSSDDLMKLFMLNIGAAAEINRLVAPGMIDRKKGNLVHVCSIASSEATGSVGYNTSKAALAAYVRTLGRELAASGVIATGILPGGFYAPANAWERLQAKNPDAVKNFIDTRLPRKFLGEAEELVPMILLLCTDAASMMGGCLVPIDAGEGRGYLNS